METNAVAGSKPAFLKSNIFQGRKRLIAVYAMDAPYSAFTQSNFILTGYVLLGIPPTPS